jgi:hypothetical protein
MADNTDRPEQPRAEPEIIPPDRSQDRSDWRRSPWRGDPFGGTRATHRVYVSRLGPFGVALLLLAVAAIVAIIIIALLGAVLIWIPIVAVLLVLAAWSRVVRGFGGR